MKRILLSLSLILAITLSAGAQIHRRPLPRRHARRHYVPAPKPRPKSQNTYYDGFGDLRLHIAGELGINDVAGLLWHDYPLHYSVGAMAELQTGRYLSLGLGAEYYGSLYNSFYIDAYYNCIPLYGNVRFSTPGYGSKCFVEVKAGYALPLNTINTYQAAGLFTGMGVGFSVYSNNLSIGMNVIDITDGSMTTDVYLRYSYAIPLN